MNKKFFIATAITIAILLLILNKEKEITHEGPGFEWYKDNGFENFKGDTTLLRNDTTGGPVQGGF